jgi:autotransporter-associated beta strand protein
LVSNPTSGRTTISGNVTGNGTVYGYNASGGSLAGVTLSGTVGLTASGGALSINGTAVGTFSRGIEIASGTTITNNGSVTLSANGSGTVSARRGLFIAGNVTINAVTGTTTVNAIDATNDVPFAPNGYTLTLSGVQNWNVSNTVGLEVWTGTLGAFNLTAMANATLNFASSSGLISNMNGWNWSLGSGSTVAINRVNLNGTFNLGGTGTLTSSLPLVGNSTINVATGGDNPIISGVFSGGFGLTKAGTGTLTLSGANTYTGATTVSGGDA